MGEQRWQLYCTIWKKPIGEEEDRPQKQRRSRTPLAELGKLLIVDVVKFVRVKWVWIFRLRKGKGACLEMLEKEEEALRRN